VLCRGKIHVTYRIERHNEWNMLWILCGAYIVDNRAK
jgi:hypothetical protein